MHNLESADGADSWAGKLQAYAQNLIVRLEANLTLIADTGIPLPAALHHTLMVDNYRLPANDERNRNSQTKSLFASSGNSLLTQGTKDIAFFEKWLSQPAQSASPLVLLAPFGCGKSVALAQFTLLLARRLLQWCQHPRDEKMPWVPFPVRLRAWNGIQHLWDYMTQQAQADVYRIVRVDERLSPNDLFDLASQHKLLPLFDGLDELGPSRSTAISQILSSQEFSDWHVITSRPGHGVERSQYGEKANFYMLEELSEDDVEPYLRTVLGDLSEAKRTEAMERFRKAQPVANQLLRRPLFLAAWCAKARIWSRSSIHAGELPASVSGLMGAVLEHVLDKRVPRQAGDAHTQEALLKKLLANRHRLGAVLAIHADAGFDVPLKQPENHVPDHPHVFIESDGGYETYAGHAEAAGLLIRRSEGTYVQKIPVVEYVIGCYYAWLADKAPIMRGSECGQKQLVQAFQRRFWWLDHDEIWLHAFEQMWQGSERQSKIAGELARWLLNLSDACVKNAKWERDLPEGQEPEDREPFHCHSFVLRTLLPTNTVSVPAQQAAEELIQLAFEQFKAYRERHWKHLGKPAGASMARLAAVRPQRMQEFLLDSLLKAKSERCRLNIVQDIADVVAHLDQEVLDRLRQLQSHPNFQKAWPAIANAIEPPGAINDTLVRQWVEKFFREKYEDVRRAVSAAMSHARNDASVVDRLFEYFDVPENRLTWPVVARALGYLPTNDRTLQKINELALSGRISAAIRIVNVVPELSWFVRDVDPNCKPGLKVIYDVARRNDDDLLINIKFAPQGIKTLLAGKTNDGDEIEKIESYDQGGCIGQLRIFVGLQVSSGEEEFMAAWKGMSKPTRTVRYKQLVRILLRPLTRTQRDQFCWKNNERGSIAVSDKSKDRSYLRINSVTLDKILKGSSKSELAEELLGLVTGRQPFRASWPDYIAPSHICNACGAVHPIEDVDNSDGKPQPYCSACGLSMPQIDPNETPSDLLHCRSQFEPPLSFLRNPPRGEWDCIPRRDDYCPCEVCRKNRKKLRDPKSKR